MTSDEAHNFYLAQIDQAHGKRFAKVVGAFQEGFLRDNVVPRDDLEGAFVRAVDTAKRLLPAIIARA